MALIFFIYSLILFSSANAFNLEWRIPVIKRGPPGSYFGYSVAEHQTLNDVSRQVTHNWLLVGAPLGQNLQPGTNRSGALWRCPMSTRIDDCDQVVTDGKRSTGGQYGGSSVDSKQLMKPLANEIKDGQWMGVTVRSQKPGGKVLVCAHRYINSGPEFQWGQGLCYTLTQELDYDDTWEPCKGRSVKLAHEEYGYCQAGTSGILLDDDTAVIGTPGVYTWRGTAFVLSTSDDYLYRDKTAYYTPHLPNNSPVDKYSYLGMSVTGAKFFSDRMSYAAGAPRANGTGQVVLFSKMTKNEATMLVKQTVPGEQFASSFGYEVSSADLNGDGYPELIVGAPFYFSREEGGAVYIYYNNRVRCLTCNPPQKLTGTPESRFGFAISNLGDINKDGFDDLAIGAPYEDLGVVYVYLGSAKGLIKEPSQVIRGRQIRSLPATFGYSLSGGVDMDGNGYPDLLVGAYDADKVVLLRSRPIINITTEVTPEAAQRVIDPTRHGCEKDPKSEHTCFSFKTCCSVDNPSSILMAHYRIEAETFQQGRKFSRVWIGHDNVTRPSLISKNIALTRQSSSGRIEHCQDHVVYLKENTKDIQSPIKLKLSYTLVQKDPLMPLEGDPLPGLDPILDQQEAAKIVEATFQKDCGSDDMCQSDLRTYVELNLPPGDGDADWALMLGRVQDLPINVTIENHGESAYEAQFFIFHAATISYNRIDSESKQVACHSHNKTVVACQVGNPLKKDSQMKFQVRFDVKQVGDTETQLDFIIFSNTTSNEVNPDEPTSLHIAVVKKAEISLKGSARPEQVFYGGAVRGESAMIFKDDIGTRVVHTYQAYNNGPWRVRDLEVVVYWPHQVANNKPQGKWLLYLDEHPTVEAHGGGQCYLSDHYVNPLGLESRPGLLDVPSTASVNTDSGRNSTESLSDVNAASLKRVRRELRVRSQRIYDPEGHSHDVVNFNCINGTAKCLKFQCIVFNLFAGQEALIRVSARLWNSTLVEDYGRVSYASVTSRAELNMAGQSLIQDRSDDIADVTTLAYPEQRDGADAEPVSIWIVVVSVVTGILCLLLVILVLWKVGFFKRNRPDPTLSGNIQKASADYD